MKLASPYDRRSKLRSSLASGDLASDSWLMWWAIRNLEARPRPSSPVNKCPQGTIKLSSCCFILVWTDRTAKGFLHTCSKLETAAWSHRGQIRCEGRFPLDKEANEPMAGLTASFRSLDGASSHRFNVPSFIGPSYSPPVITCCAIQGTKISSNSWAPRLPNRYRLPQRSV